MLINSLKTSNNPIYLKSHSFKSKSPKTFPIKSNAVFYTPKANELCSRFNINFTSRLDEDKKLDEFCLRLENKIKEMTTPKDPEITSWVMTPDYLDLINETFKKDNIGRIIDNGLSANSMLRYLSKKRQIQLSGSNRAFVIDEMSLENLKKTGIKNFLANQPKRDIRFYCLDTNEKETEELIEEFNKLTNNSFEVKRIKRPENSNFSKSLDAKKIKAIIESYANIKFESDEERKQFIDIITRYLDNNFLVFSYATLCEKLKELYKKIEEQVKVQGKTMDDVIYILPEKSKSCSLINYFYAKTNSVPIKQFKRYVDIYFNSSDEKIYVILDDLCASGASIREDMNDITYPDNLLLGFVVACKKGIEKVNDNLKEKNLKNTKIICNSEYKDLGIINDKLRQEDKCAAKELLGQFKNFNLDDIDFLSKNIKGGFGSMHTFINFPYMIPDNSSELNAFFGGYFLNNDNTYANKIVKTPGFYDMLGIRYGEYIKIKNNIENTINESPS